jgi:hypothetical protein
METIKKSSRSLKLLPVTFIALAASLVANLVVLYFTKPLAPDFVPLSLPTVGVWTTLAVLVAGGVFGVIRMRSQNPGRTFMWVSVVVLLLSFIPDVMLFFVSVPGFVGITTGGILALMAMHVITAVIVVKLFLCFTKSPEKGHA